MAYQTLLVEVKDQVATIILNRPDAYNALNLQLASEFFHAALEADEDRAVRCIAVTAARLAKLAMAYSKRAATPGGSSSYFLPRMIGLRRALELHYTNRMLSAKEALEWGLVNRVVPDAEFPQALSALARELAQGPTLAFGGAKLLFHQSTQESLETQMELEAQSIARSGLTEDFKTGVTAFAQKKAATFKGR